MKLTRDEDPRVPAVLADSALLRPVDAGIDAIWKSSSNSETAKLLQRVGQPWREFSAAERSLAGGLMLIVAALIYMVLTLMTEAPPGWLWLVAPAAAVSVGLVRLLWSRVTAQLN